MIKILLRIGMILLVAGVVTGGWYLLAGGMGTGTAGLPGGKERGRPNLPAGTTGSAAAPEGAFRPEGRGARGGGEHREGRGMEGMVGGEWGGLAMQFGKVGLITLGVVGVQWIGKKLTRKRQPVQAVTAN